jgi:hypothetical protein
MINDRESIPCLALHCIALHCNRTAKKIDCKKEGKGNAEELLQKNCYSFQVSLPLALWRVSSPLTFFSVWPIWAFWSCWSSFLPPFGLAQLAPGSVFPFLCICCALVALVALVAFPKFQLTPLRASAGYESESD